MIGLTSCIEEEWWSLIVMRWCDSALEDPPAAACFDTPIPMLRSFLTLRLLLLLFHYALCGRCVVSFIDLVTSQITSRHQTMHSTALSFTKSRTLDTFQKAIMGGHSIALKPFLRHSTHYGTPPSHDQLKRRWIWNRKGFLLLFRALLLFLLWLEKNIIGCKNHLF